MEENRVPQEADGLTMAVDSTKEFATFESASITEATPVPTPIEQALASVPMSLKMKFVITGLALLLATGVLFYDKIDQDIYSKIITTALTVFAGSATQ